MTLDAAVIGAGPAGMAAALELARAGASVAVFDMQAQSGGQILRQPPAAFTVRQWLSQRIYRRLHRLRDAYEAQSGIERVTGAEVLGVAATDGGFTLQVRSAEGVYERAARRVLIATGACDMPVAFPGGQLPGVMAAGGIQAFVKSQQFVPGGRFVFAGSHPLQLIVANQVAAGGGQVAAVVFSQSLGDFLRLLLRPGPLLSQPGNALFFAGQVIKALRFGIPLRFGQVIARANGTERLESVDLRPTHNAATQQISTLPCDRLGTCYGFLTQTELLRQAGATCRWSEQRGGWVASHDAQMQSSVDGLYVAGESTGVAGADAARLEGRIAGVAMAEAGGHADARETRSERRTWQSQLDAVNAFADRLATFSHTDARTLLALMQDEATLCKCEEVTAGEVRRVLAAYPETGDLSGLKLVSRCGMGPCQGRYCHYQLHTLMTDVTGRDPEQLGGFTARFPARPVRIGDLID